MTVFGAFVVGRAEFTLKEEVCEVMSGVYGIRFDFEETVFVEELLADKVLVVLAE